MEKLEGLPAIIHSILWEVREMGYFGKVLKKYRVKNMRILLYFEDYGGAFIVFDEGDFIISPIDSTKLGSISFDGAVFGKLREIIKAFEGNIVWRLIKSYLKKDIRVKGRIKLIKFGLVLLKCLL
jgi:hypothetical protein